MSCNVKCGEGFLFITTFLFWGLHACVDSWYFHIKSLIWIPLAGYLAKTKETTDDWPKITRSIKDSHTLTLVGLINDTSHSQSFYKTVRRLRARSHPFSWTGRCILQWIRGRFERHIRHMRRWSYLPRSWWSFLVSPSSRPIVSWCCTAIV